MLTLECRPGRLLDTPRLSPRGETLLKGGDDLLGDLAADLGLAGHLGFPPRMPFSYTASTDLLDFPGDPLSRAVALYQEGSLGGRVRSKSQMRLAFGIKSRETITRPASRRGGMAVVSSKRGRAWLPDYGNA